MAQSRVNPNGKIAKGYVEETIEELKRMVSQRDQIIDELMANDYDTGEQLPDPDPEKIGNALLALGTSLPKAIVNQYELLRILENWERKQ